MPVTGGIISRPDGWYVWSNGAPDAGPYPDHDEALKVQRFAVDARNRATSLAEAEAFAKGGVNGSYFAYWHEASERDRELSTRATMRLPIATITTWMGDLLARVTWNGHPYRCSAFGGFPSVRVNFRASGIDGREWYGTYYKSSGSYVHMSPLKGKKGKTK